jgi:hypothetical protein
LWLNAFGSTLSLPFLQINSMFTRAKVSCHHNHFVVALCWVSKYLRDMLLVKTFFSVNLSSVAMSLGNSLLQIVPFHELAISTKPLLIFYFQKRLGVPSCIKTPPIANPLASICTSKDFRKLVYCSIGVDDNFPFKRSNAFCYSSFFSNGNSKRLVNGLANVKKSLMNFL